MSRQSVDVEALCGEIALVFGHYIILCVLTCVQVVGEISYLEARRFKLGQGEIEKGTVVCFEFDASAVLQKLLELFKKRSVRKSALFVTRLWPRIAEIYVYNVKRFLGEYLLDDLGVRANELEILKLLCFRFFSGENNNVAPWDMPLNEKCPQCEKILFYKKSRKQVYCADKECGYKRDEIQGENNEK